MVTGDRIPSRCRRADEGDSDARSAAGTPSGSHSGVISAFVHRLVRGGDLEDQTGRLLRSLFERRNEADSSPVDVPLEEADAAIRDADRVVGAVEVWLSRRASP
jgi:uncharacterized protein (UPF0332 family)